MKFNCPFCDEEFVNKNTFDNHMNNHNENSYDDTVVYCRGQPLEYSFCKLCGEKFDNESDVKVHKDKMHMTNNLYGKRIKQNLMGIDLEVESEDEYIPSENEDIEENDNFLTRKRKRIEKPAEKTKKKSKTEFRCGKCESTFSRKDSLNRHVKNYCKK